MKPIHTIRLFVAALVTPLLLATQAHAQFPGDVFFSNSSPTVIEGEDLVVKVQLFSGSEVFGAALVDIEFDESLFEIIEIREAGNATWSEKSYAVENAGRLSLAVFNDSSLSQPIGTVGLVELVIRPKFPVGESAVVSISGVETLKADTSVYSSAQGFDMTVTVTGSVVTTLSKGFLSIASVASLEEGKTVEVPRVPITDIDAKVPAGTRVRLWSSEVDAKGRRIWSVPEVQTYDPNAPSD